MQYDPSQWDIRITDTHTHDLYRCLANKRLSQKSKYPISDKKSLEFKSCNMGIKNSYLNFRCRAKFYINLKIISLLKWREQRTGI